MDRLLATATLLRDVPKASVSATAQALRTILLRPTTACAPPGHLQVEIITSCNLGCVMCPRTVAIERASADPQWHRRMPLDRFLTLLDEFPTLQSLSLHGIGEPLMHPQLFEMITAAARRDIKVRFTTNATLLDRDRSHRVLASRLHRLIVSLDGATAPTYEAIRPGARFVQVVENVRFFANSRRESRAAQPRLDISMVVQASNANEAPALVALAHELGADGVILSPMIPPVKELAALCCDSATWNQAVDDSRRKARRLGIAFFAREGRPLPDAAPKATHRCMHAWFSAVVTLEGAVMPCCNIHDPAFGMGNALEDGFTDVWNGERYRAFRREIKQQGHVPEACRKCPEF
jgi:radical SAM protein with 4Fe4S-binding SPASM domain